MIKNIIDIPVYSCTKEEYDLRYQEYLNSFDQSRELIKTFSHPSSIWKYNNIIGYISVSLDITKHDMTFDIFKYLGRIYISTTKKRCIQNMLSDGWHFNISNLSNSEISYKAKEMVDEIAIRFFKNRYVDKNIFNNTIDYIDFLKIMEDTQNG